jgi:GTP cyclohydrolase I
MVDEIRRNLERDIRDILLSLLITDEEVLQNTPSRLANALLELTEGLRDKEGKLDEIFSSTFPTTSKELVLVKDIRTESLCPHHFLPVIYRINFAYIPNGKAIGLSKIPRFISLLAHQPKLQEDFTQEIADVFMSRMNPIGCMTIVKGTHSCILLRGVRQSAEVVTSAVRGTFTRGDLKEEVLKVMGL